jgi:pimeloyl-ACP methyl ester carboxylesterase
MIRTVVEAAQPGRTAPTRVLMLPPAFTGHSDFVQHGFVRAVRERSLQVDLVFAEFRLEQAIDQRLITGLLEDIALSVRAPGSALWIGGISLGGYLALGCAERDPREFAGLCLIAPYLGSHLITAEIARAQGLESWRAGEPPDEDHERRIWQFIRTLRTAPMAVHLGLGRDDRFAGRHALMAAALPAASVDIVAGGHDWPTWRRLWDQFLDARLAPKAGPARSPS